MKLAGGECTSCTQWLLLSSAAMMAYRLGLRPQTDVRPSPLGPENATCLPCSDSNFQNCDVIRCSSRREYGIKFSINRTCYFVKKKFESSLSLKYLNILIPLYYKNLGFRIHFCECRYAFQFILCNLQKGTHELTEVDCPVVDYVHTLEVKTFLNSSYHMGRS